MHLGQLNKAMAFTAAVSLPTQPAHRLPPLYISNLPHPLLTSVSTQDPTVFESFCRVGTGLSDNEKDVLHEKLKDIMVRADTSDSARAGAPPCYRVVATPEGRPDMWISDPKRSIVLEVKSDIRLIRSRCVVQDVGTGRAVLGRGRAMPCQLPHTLRTPHTLVRHYAGRVWREKMTNRW